MDGIMFPTDHELEQAVKTETAAAYKPAHGGYPTYAKAEEELSLKLLDEAFETPNNTIPGSEWTTSYGGLPLNYFDAVKLHTALQQIAHEAQARVQRLNEAIRNVRLKKPGGLDELSQIYHAEMQGADTDLLVRLAVNELADTIDPDIHPATALTPSLSVERYYALRPVWEFINKARRVFKRTDG